MLERGKLFQGLEDNRSAIGTFQKVEQMHERMTRCGDREVIRLNLAMALSYSELGQNDLSLDYLNRALCLTLKILGEHNISVMSFSIYLYAATVKRNCGRYDEAKLLFERSLKLAESLHGDIVHAGKIVKLK